VGGGGCVCDRLSNRWRGGGVDAGGGRVQAGRGGAEGVVSLVPRLVGCLTRPIAFF
jgi:hypothetical protein